MKTRAIIKIHYLCNNNCYFCHCSDNKRKGIGHSLAAKLEEASSLGIDEILLSGGEPTIDRELFDIISQIRNERFSIGLISNGRMFSYKTFCEKLFRHDPRYFYISLHSAKREIHDRISMASGAWEQTIAGIQNITDAGFSDNLIVNCVITRENIEDIKNNVALLEKLGVKKIKFSYPDVKGNMLHNRSLMVEPLKASEKITLALDECERDGLIGLYDGLPYCYVPERHRMKLDNLESNGILYMSEKFEDRFFRTDEGERKKDAECIRCSLHSICRGYHPLNDMISVKPITAKVPESIIFKRDEMKSRSPKTITLRDKDGDFNYTYRGDFFKVTNIDAIRREGNLFYMDQEEKSFLKKLKILEKGEKGKFTKGEMSFYDLASEAIEKETKDLKGKVLDVGFGDRNIFSHFKKLEDEGKIYYTGIDPSARCFDSAVAEYPGVDFRKTSLEEFSKNKENLGRYNHIFMIGSYNHIRDLDGALEALERLIDAEGRIVIIENNLMGIIVKSDDDGEAEHFRNHSIREARMVLSEKRFEILEEEDYGPFWKVVMRKKNGKA